MIFKMLQTNKRLPLTLNLQHFAEEEIPGGDNLQDNPDEKVTNTEGDNPGGDTKDTKKDPDKDKPESFTQEQMSKRVAAETKQERIKILKELGIEDVSKGKEALKAYKKQVEDQKTDAEKVKDRADELEKLTGEKDQTISNLTTQLAALKADVDPEKLDDATFLANKYVSDETTVDEAIQMVLEKYPQFKKTQEAPEDKDKKPKPKLGSDNYQADEKVTDAEKWAAAFK